jgi:hypothetical protein
MRYLILVVIAVLGVGCGGYETRPTPYKCLVYPFGWVQSEKQLDCQVVVMNVIETERIFARYRTVPCTQPEWDAAFGNLPIRIYDTDALEDDGEEITIGRYNPNTGVALTRAMTALPHELLHHLDAIRLQPGTKWHEGWDRNGYNDMQEQYQNRYRSPVPKD